MNLIPIIENLSQFIQYYITIFDALQYLVNVKDSGVLFDSFECSPRRFTLINYTIRSLIHCVFLFPMISESTHSYGHDGMVSRPCEIILLNLSLRTAGLLCFAILTYWILYYNYLAMIEQNTVLVLGAGASVPSGFPTGQGLKDQICEKTLRKNISIMQLLGFDKDLIKRFGRALAPSDLQ